MKFPVNPDESGCSGLTSLQDLCQHGPSCQLIKATKYPNCPQFNCKDCSFADSQPGFQTVHGDFSQSEDEDASQSEHEDNSQSGNEDAPPPVAASSVELEPILCSVEGNVWTAPNPFTLASCFNKPSPFTPVISPVLAELNSTSIEGEDQSFSLSELSEDAYSCVAYGGPGAGQICKFPFTYENVKYFDCAGRNEGNSEGWCSTKMDINGAHLTGPVNDTLKYVGFCDESCQTSSLFKKED